MRSHTIDLTTGPIGKKLLRFAMPLVITNLLQHLYQAADNAVVGQFAGSSDLAAVGATSSATLLILNIIFGLAIGANIVNANLRGAGKFKELRKSLHTTIALSIVGGVLVSIAGQFLCRPLLEMMKCPETIIDKSVLYMRIIFCGTPATMVYTFGSGILRTYGDSKRPMFIMALSGLLNVVLNLIFVICFHMTVDGVALATIISKYMSAIWVVIILFSPKDEFKLKVKEIKLHKQQALNIIKVGIPCGINSVVFSLSNTIVQTGINGFGAVVVAGGVASNNVTSLLYAVLSAFYSASVSIVGQCYGAGKYKRIDGVLIRGCMICCCFTLLAALLISSFPGVFIGIFNRDADVIAVGSQKLIIMSWSYILAGISEICIGVLRGIRKAAVPTTINIVCVCVLRIAWVLFISPLSPNDPMLLYWCYPVSYICSASALVIYYLICRRQLFVQKASPVTAK